MIEIDQSGKIEQTEKDTVLCLSNDKWDAVLIEAKTKRQLQEIFRRNGQIGKGAMAHHWAHEVAVKELPAKRVITQNDLLGEIKKTEVGKRLKNA